MPKNPVVLSTDRPMETIDRLIRGGAEVLSNTPAVSLILPKGGAEAEWLATEHVGYIHAMHGEAVVFWGYEWMSFKLPGGSYTPDFLYLLADGRLVFVECKGSKNQANYRDARSKLRAAATLNPWFWFYEVRIEKSAWNSAWNIERIEPDQLWLSGLVNLEAHS